MQATTELRRLDATTGPVVKSVEARATYVRGKATEWRVPLILHDEIELYDGQRESRNIINDYEYLVSLVESGRPFVYSEGEQSWTVFATGFLWSPTTLSSVAEGWQGVFTLIFREVK